VSFADLVESEDPGRLDVEPTCRSVRSNLLKRHVREREAWSSEHEAAQGRQVDAKLAPADALDELRARAMPGELDKVADPARALREWFRAFVRKHMGRSLTPKALRELGPLNRLLERDEAFSQISRPSRSDGDRLELRMTRRWRSPEALLLPIGEALARFVCEEDFANVRACGGHSCTLVFADRTRRRARRWCSMAVCGNRAKQAAHRKRLKNK
jgi:predicted RNA-binding Zn ribbon-like protein